MGAGRAKLASASADNTVIVWDLARGAPAQTLQGHSAFVNGVAWGPAGQLASASGDPSGLGDNTVIVWDLARGPPTHGAPAQTLQAH